jgi:transketolase
MNQVPMRDGYGKALLQLAAENEKVVVLDADVAKSTRTVWIRDQYPEKFIDMGISEQDMVGTAAGLALAGMLPFASTYGVFLSGRAWDQIRTTVCYNHLNVKLAGAHAGISVGPDGATHQALEDVAIMRVLPGMTVVVPCDAEETRKATLAAAAFEGPCYLRFGREAVPVITKEQTPFQIGKANEMHPGTDAAVIANGAMVSAALQAAALLEQEGVSVRVINMHTVKPLDRVAVLAAARECGCIVTAEEHQMTGGLGGAVAETLACGCPVPMEIVGVEDSFGESGEPEELMRKYGLSAEQIVKKIRAAMARRDGRLSC